MHSQIQIEISLCIGACQRKQKSRFLHCFSSLSFVFFTRIKGKFPWSRISWNGTLLFRLYNTHIIIQRIQKRELRAETYSSPFSIGKTPQQDNGVSIIRWKNYFFIPGWAFRQILRFSFSNIFIDYLKVGGECCCGHWCELQVVMLVLKILWTWTVCAIVI